VICPVPDQPSAITGIADACPGEWDYEVPGNNGLEYQWSVSGGGTISGSGSKIKVTWTTTGTHTLSVTPVAACGETGVARTLTVEVRIPRTVGAVTNMLPAEGAVNTYLPVNLTWTAAANADAYDVYIWHDSVAA